MAERPVITTNNGQLRGVLSSSDFSGRFYYSFYGIPYAEPPTEEHRFKVGRPLQRIIPKNYVEINWFLTIAPPPYSHPWKKETGLVSGMRKRKEARAYNSLFMIKEWLDPRIVCTWMFTFQRYAFSYFIFRLL